MLFFIIVLLCLIAQFFFSWWIIGAVSFLMSFWISRSARHAFFSGFGALFVLWSSMGLLKSIPNQHILANKVSQMAMLPPDASNWLIILLVSGAVGGLAAGCSALAGFYCRQVVMHL